MPTWPPEVQESIAAARMISLFLDFDGTLTPAAEPEEGRLDASTRQTLSRLAHRRGVVTTIISGRALDDLRIRVNLRDIIYAGNRGLEISGRNLEFVEPIAAARSVQLVDITDDLAFDLRSIPGVVVDFKGLTSTVNYRRAADRDIPAIEEAVRVAVAPFTALFEVESGKKVFDIIPRTGWHKGCAVSWINGKLGLEDALCVYFGNDQTDEEVFNSLPGAVTFKVGEQGESLAKYRVESPAEVCELLQCLVRTK